MVIAHIKKQFLLAITTLLVSCQQHHQMHMTNTSEGTSPANKEERDPIDLKTEDNPQQEASQKPICAFVYIHGLNMDAHEGDAVVEAVKKLHGNQVLIIQPTCREGSKSARLLINEQAEKVFAEIQQKIEEARQNKYPQYIQKKLQDLPINLFGYSQGGVIACILAESYKDGLNIRTVTLAHAPLSGTSALENTPSDVRQFIRKGEAGLQAIGYNTKSPSSFGRKVAMHLSAACLNWPIFSNMTTNIAKGLGDMRQDSRSTKRTKKFIREDEHNIPILIIAGYTSGLKEHFDFEEHNEQKVHDLSNAYAELTTKQEGGEHDLLISLRSQLCRTASFKNLASSKDDPVYPPNVEIHIAKDVLHCYNLITILSDFQVHYGKTFFQSDESIEAFTNFLGKHNDLKNLTEDSK